MRIARSERIIGPISPLVFGHNTVWCRGGLGVWDERRQRLDDEVLAATRALKPGLLRFPGGTRAMAWHFDETLGDARRAQLDPFRGVDDSTRYGIDEGLAFVESVGAELSLVAPWVEGSPEETAALVAYVCGDASSDVRIGVDDRGRDWGTAGEWARRRGRAPHRLRFLEVGNEPYLGLPVGPTGFRQCERRIGGRVVATTARAYAQALVRTCELVRAIAPDVRIGACALGGLFDHEDPVGAGDEGDAWNARIAADGAFDHWIAHAYVVEPTDARLQLGARIRRLLRELRGLADRPIAITEYGFLFGGDTTLAAAVAVDVVRVAIEERAVMAVRHLLIEDDPNGPFANAAAILGPERTRTPASHAMALMAETLGGDAFVVDAPEGVSAIASERAIVATRLAGDGEVELEVPGARTLITLLPSGEKTFVREERAVDGRVRVRLPPHAIAALR